MNSHVSKIIEQLAPARHHEDETQLVLFPQLHQLRAVAPQSPQSIRLPRSILVIDPAEQLNQFLSRVADAAMTAATKSCGTPQKAAIRLGTAHEPPGREPNQGMPTSKKGTLRLATSNR